jgi:hypothetical protein
MSEQPVDPNESDQHTVSPENGPAKKHGDELEEVVTDGAEMHDEQ